MTFNGKQPLMADKNCVMTKYKDPRCNAPIYLYSYFSWSLTLTTMSHCESSLVEILEKQMQVRQYQRIWYQLQCKKHLNFYCWLFTNSLPADLQQICHSVSCMTSPLTGAQHTTHIFTNILEGVVTRDGKIGESCQ